jgi:hypothetical protein
MLGTAMTTFPIVPASGTWMLAVLVVPCLALLALALVVVGATAFGSQRSSFEVNDEGLVLHGDLYGRAIPRADLAGGDVRIVNLEREHDLQPVRRTRGTAIPGYRAGWFRLADGRKALLYVTDESRVVYVPTKAGYVVLLSATDPDGLAEALRRLAAAS